MLLSIKKRKVQLTNINTKQFILVNCATLALLSFSFPVYATRVCFLFFYIQKVNIYLYFSYVEAAVFVNSVGSEISERLPTSVMTLNFAF